jgi:SAM-dependent methyltransferase
MIACQFELKNYSINLCWSDELQLKSTFKLQTGGSRTWKNAPDTNEHLISRMKNSIDKNYQRVFEHNNIDIFSINKLVDIGCGISLLDLSLHQINPAIEFHLVDKSEISVTTESKYFSFENNHGFYNDWRVVEDCIKTTSLDATKFFMHDPDDIWPNDVDVILSMYSYCWHYPKEVYWKKVLSSLKLGGYLILDILNLKDQSVVEEISDVFGSKPISQMKYLYDYSKTETHPYINEFSIIDGSYGGLHCFQRLK